MILKLVLKHLMDLEQKEKILKALQILETETVDLQHLQQNKKD